MHKWGVKMLPLKITLKNIRDKAKPFIVRVFNKDIDKKLLPLIVKVKSHEITPDLIIKPIEIFIAEIDILYAAVKPIILFKHSSSCKDSFVYYFGNVISKTKFNSYIKQGGLYFSYIAKSKNTFFKNKFSVRGLT